jgi:hypothetical protein
MKFEEAAELLSLSGFCFDVVGGEPVLIEPEIKQQDAEKAREIERILFDRDRSAKSGCFDSEGRILVREGEEVSCEEEVQTCSNGKEEADGP